MLIHAGDISNTGGEKDVMSLSARGYNAITLNSETATLDTQIAGQLKLRFDKDLMLLFTVFLV